MGLTPEQYRARQQADEKWCSGCKAWHPTVEFGGSANHPDGKQPHCRKRKRIYALEAKREEI